MSQTIPEQFRPRKPKKKFSIKFYHYILILVFVAIAGLVLLSTNAAQQQEKRVAVRTAYNLGSILRVDFANDNLASDLETLASKLDYIKDAGFDTILLPPLQPGIDVPYGESSVRAVSNWETIDEAYGDERQLKSLISLAEKNSQHVLMTLPTGIIAKSNPWANSTSNWFLDEKQKKDFAEKSNLDGLALETVEILGGRSFSTKSYVTVIDYWVKNFQINGVYISGLSNGISSLSNRTLELLRTDNVAMKDFVVISGNEQSAGIVRSGFSAVITEDVSRIVRSIESQFDPDALALALGQAMDYRAGPTLVRSNDEPNPNYLKQNSNGQQSLDFATALAYALPGVPIVDSKSLTSSSSLALYRNLNNDFANFQDNEVKNPKVGVEFFVASNDGTVGLAITRNEKVSIIFVNANTEKQFKAAFSIPQQFRGNYEELESRLEFKVTEEFQMDLHPLSVTLFTKK